MRIRIDFINDVTNKSGGIDFKFPAEELLELDCYDFGKDRLFLIAINVLLNEAQRKESKLCDGDV